MFPKTHGELGLAAPLAYLLEKAVHTASQSSRPPSSTLGLEQQNHTEAKRQESEASRAVHQAELLPWSVQPQPTQSLPVWFPGSSCRKGLWPLHPPPVHILSFLQLIKEKLLDLLGKEEEEGSHDENMVRTARVGSTKPDAGPGRKDLNLCTSFHGLRQMLSRAPNPRTLQLGHRPKFNGSSVSEADPKRCF